MSENLNPNQQRMEDLLRQATPAAVRIDRDALMFEAGRASADHRRLWPWQASLTAALALSVTLIALRPAPREIERVVVVHDPAQTLPQPASEPMRITPPAAWLAPAGGYLAMRDTVLNRGVDVAIAPRVQGPPAAIPARAKTLEGSEALPPWQRRTLDGGRS